MFVIFENLGISGRSFPVRYKRVKLRRYVCVGAKSHLPEKSTDISGSVQRAQRRSASA